MIATVLGATGKTGSVVAQRLRAGGAEVRAFARSADKLEALTKQGAKAVTGDVVNARDLVAAFRGSDVVYAMVPPFYSAPDPIGYYDRVTASLATALAESGVRRVVLLSSLGADRSSGTGLVVGLHHVEERLKTLPRLDLLILRPGYFYENFLGSIGTIQAMGVNGGATKGDVPITMISASDIGGMAARAMLAADFAGITVRELFGPRDLTMVEATSILGKMIGNPDLAYQQFPAEGVIAGLKQAGFSEGVAKSFVGMSEGFNEGRMRATQPRTRDNTGQVTFEEFAGEFAQAYAALTMPKEEQS
jgi:uncharacterized protein YbjT (DUF2867 family)